MNDNEKWPAPVVLFQELNRMYFHNKLTVKEIKYSYLAKNQLACTRDDKNRPHGTEIDPTIYLNLEALQEANIHTFMRVMLHEMIHVYQFNTG